MKKNKIYLIVLLLFNIIISQEQSDAPKKVGLALLTEPAPSNPSIIQVVHLKRTRPETGSVTAWYNSTQRRDPLQVITPRVSYKDFSWYLYEFIRTQKHFLNTTAWVNTPINTEDPDLKDSALPNSMRPCVLKLATQPGSRIFLWGDLHGDIRTLNSSLYKLYQDKVIDNDFKILNPNCYFFFLGDMVDRGQHGIDTLLLLFIFATKNPGKVFLVRGNHEDLTLNKKEYYQRNTILSHFYQQLKLFSDINRKTEQEFNTLLNNIVLFYNVLPVAAFIGCNNNYIQCCHGGLEVRYNPEKLLNSSYSIALEAIESLSMPEIWYKEDHFGPLEIDTHSCIRQFKNLSLNNMTPFDVGFLWNDFNVLNNHKTYCEPGRGIMMGRLFTEKIFEFYNKKNAQVKGVIRAHQHNLTMPGLLNPQNTGVFSLWNNQVFTTVATSMFINAMTFIELITEQGFNNWHLKNFNLKNPYQGSWSMRESTLSNWQNIVV